jgi:hypothetical protein
MSTILLLSGFAWRQSMIMVDIANASGEENKWPRVIANYGTTLTKLLDPEQFPALTEAITSGLFDEEDEGFSGEFQFGLNRILDGVAQLIDSRKE